MCNLVKTVRLSIGLFKPVCSCSTSNFQGLNLVVKKYSSKFYSKRCSLGIVEPDTDEVADHTISLQKPCLLSLWGCIDQAGLVLFGNRLDPK